LLYNGVNKRWLSKRQASFIHNPTPPNPRVRFIVRFFTRSNAASPHFHEMTLALTGLTF